MLLDCGEGIYGQMVRLFGLEVASEILCQLSGVYVSHLHADHHLGFINVALHRKKALLDRQLPVSSDPPRLVSLFCFSSLDLTKSIVNMLHRKFDVNIVNLT